MIGGKVGGATGILFVVLVCIWPKVIHCQSSPSLIDYAPKSGPIAGGTEINVTGEGFITTGSFRSKCRIEVAGRGSVLSGENLLHNETFLTCILPEIPFLTSSQLQGGTRMTRLTITGGPGTPSNSVEFFTYDLDQIQVRSISPTEGLVNTTNITLSIRGQNFLDTNEITCSVAGLYRVPAQYINSSFLQCQLAPFPETARVTIDVSTNGQSVANIAPLTIDSTTFTYFASPPRIQSCRLTPSYAQLLLSLDREVEIGGEQRAYPATQPPLSCSDIFTQSTLQGVIGLNSTCFWHNAQQRTVVVWLASDTQVQPGSIVTIQDNTIRTRYVQYSRLASGSVTISSSIDSPQLLPLAVLEAPSVIPYCGTFTVSGAKSQYGGSRDLEYRWTVGTEYDENSTLIEDSVVASSIPRGFTSQSVLELSSDLFNPDLLGSGLGSADPINIAKVFDIQLQVRNFLGFISTARISNISRAETPHPSVSIIGGELKRIRISDETLLEGCIILQRNDCLMQEHIGDVTYTWSIVDQFDRTISLASSPHSPVLVLPPYSLEVDSEYTATLSVDFRTYSVVVSASARLLTDVELVNLKAKIRGGVRRSVRMNDTIQLDGQSSEFVNTSSVVLGITWRCTLIDSDESCTDRNGQIFSFSSNGLVQLIPSGTLQPGTYNFTLTLTLIWESQDAIVVESSAYQILVILPYSVPRVEFIPDTRVNLESVLVHKELILNVGIQSDLSGVAEWTSEYVVGKYTVI